MTTLRYRLRPSNTFAAVIVRNDDSKLLSRLGHDHVVRADEFTSTVAIDSENPEQLRFSLDFAVRSLVIDADEDRRRVGLDGTVSNKDRRTTQKNMLAEDQLNAEEFGNIGFRVDGAHPGSQQWVMDATLSVQQTNFDFDFPVSVQFEPQLRVEGEVELTHRDLGLEPYRAPMGTLQNKQELTFVVDVDAAPL